MSAVFPAQAGVFPTGTTAGRGSCSIPRASGGVPELTAPADSPEPYSPRKRGCSFPCKKFLSKKLVFPAQAGVFRGQAPCSWRICSIPRASGGVPASGYIIDQLLQYSPHKRGCSHKYRIFDEFRIVFPAQAGVFLKKPVHEA